MAEFTITIEGLSELKAAVARNPQVVLSEVKRFLVQGLKVYTQGIIRQPWRMGASGGGAPVATGHLRDFRHTEIYPFEAKIVQDAPYAAYVHGLDGKTRNIRGVQLRPWLDFVQHDKDPEIIELQNKLLANITGDLAR